MKYTIFLFLFIGNIILSQKTISPTFIDSLSLSTMDLVSFDSYNNYYYLKNNVLYKKTNAKSVEYKNLALGKISMVDTQNPLQLVVLFNDFNTVILLDNQLNETNKINGNIFEIPLSFNHVSLANGNQFWFYDLFSQKIGLYNFKKNAIKFISTPLNSSIKNHKSNYNNYFWIDQKNNFYTITVYGKITFLGKIPEYDEIQIITDRNSILKKDNYLYFFDIKNDDLIKIEIRENSFQNFFFKDGILSIFTNNNIINYKIILP